MPVLRKSFAVANKKLSELIPDEKNANKGTERGSQMIENSLRTYGAGRSILIDKHGRIIAGNKTAEHAGSIGLDDVLVVQTDGTKLVAVQRMDLDLNEKQAQEMAIADNRAGQVSLDWDANVLKELDVDLAKFWTEDELSVLLADPIASLLTDEDDVPELPDEPKTKLGDLYVLGNHRLLCGDSTSATDVEKLLDGVKPLLMVTDPPYGVEYDPTWRDGKGGFSTAAVKQRGKVRNDDRDNWQEAYALFPGDVAYVWHPGLHTGIFFQTLADAGFIVRAQIIWVKQQGVFSQGHYHWQHEPCLYGVRKNATAHWSGDRKQTTVWQIQSLNPTGNRTEERVGHGTQKPVECMRRPIQNNSSPGQAVYDPFLGSGTTLIACETEGRVCYGMELDPKYCDVIVTRWEQATGKKAVFDGASA